MRLAEPLLMAAVGVAPERAPRAPALRSLDLQLPGGTGVDGARRTHLAELLTARRRAPDELAGLDIGAHRPVSRAEALAVAVSSTLRRLQGEQRAADGSSPYRAAADAGRRLLAGLGTASAVDELMAERRAEAEAEDALAAGHESRR